MRTRISIDRRRAPLLSRADGFSLVEAIAAVGLMAVVLLGSAIGADKAIRFNSYNRTLATATTLAQDKIEQLQSLARTHPDLGAGAHGDPTALTARGAPGGTYTRTWQVTPNRPEAGINTIEVRVTWTIQNRNHGIRVVTYRMMT